MTDPAKPIGEEELLDAILPSEIKACGCSDCEANVAKARRLLSSFLEAKAEEMANIAQEEALMHEGATIAMRQDSLLSDDDYTAAEASARTARRIEAALRAVGKGDKR